MAAESPVEITMRDRRVEVRRRDTDELLATCFIGDDEGVETIADLLSAKRLPEDAMRLRQLAMDCRKFGAPTAVRLSG